MTCPTCKEWYTRTFPDSHKCSPTWRVWCPEYGSTVDDSPPIYGREASDAAKKWAEDFDSDGDYTIVGGEELEVCVQSTAGGKIWKFNVSGEAVPQYHAREL